MDDYDGLHKTNPRLSFAMTLAMFSLAGIPPFAGFFSKILIFTAVTSTGSMALYMLVLIALINTIISLYYYLLVVKAIWIKASARLKSKASRAQSVRSLHCGSALQVLYLRDLCRMYMNTATRRFSDKTSSKFPDISDRGIKV